MYIELEGHMMAQNDTLDEADNLHPIFFYPHFGGTPKIPLFWPKSSIFGDPTELV